MRIALFAPLFACLCTAAAASALGADPAIKGGHPNAAVVYWQAFAAMPTLKMEESNRISDVAANPSVAVPADVRALVDRHRIALQEFSRGAKIAACDWNLDYEQGPYLLLPHASKMRDLARIALLRARIRLADGNPADAIDDLLAAFAASRNVAKSPLLVSYLVGQAIENLAIEVLLVHLPSLPPVELTRLEKGLADLAPFPTIVECLEIEGTAFTGWFVRTVDREFTAAEPKLRQEWLQKLIAEIGPNLFGEDNKPILDFAKVTPEFIRKSIARLKDDYSELKRIAELKGKARREQQAKFEAEIRRLKKTPKEGDIDRLLSAAVLPGLTRIFDREESGAIRRRLLGIAIAVAKDGEGALEKLPQPGEGKVAYNKIEGGFELSVRYLESEKVETMRVGPPPKEK